ncbi:DUF4249 domain-containing protein [Spirosoma sp. KCTC 42546]|uniref:DUF4249 domain-containing protein n=1 Tax=Spirosoma sp. KCTC 42546 TaxID=2520506 RepID=UPI00115BB406|nr:DUF4249 domain-containing protein [Spirosoma sp. KCTC 42546]QDK81008.1 DUF4249 domain-containing protein [Spirosoma sp. KCTC 42546]
MGFKHTSIKFLAWLLVLLVSGCVDPYRPPEITSPASYLVVNGFFNSAAGTTTTIQLSRTQNLADPKAPSAETKAIVTIESAHKDIYTLKEGTVGSYTLTGVIPVANETYRLHVKTTKGTEYYSDYVPVLTTPPIDSITWHPDNEGLQINVNTHDPKNNTRYYRYEYESTWEYYSEYTSSFEIKNNKIVDRTESVFQCWGSENSSTIITTTTNRLSQDVVSQFPITHIPSTSLKLQSKYSILIRQFGLSQEGFNYYDQLAKITQSIGSIFDPQPSQITGNIHSSVNDGDLVLGFFRVGTVESKRIFIRKAQLPAWYTNNGLGSCVVDTMSTGDVLKEQPGIISLLVPGQYLTTSEPCLDCRLRGGVIKKPDFWE